MAWHGVGQACVAVSAVGGAMVAAKDGILVNGSSEVREGQARRETAAQYPCGEPKEMLASQPICDSLACPILLAVAAGDGLCDRRDRLRGHEPTVPRLPARGGVGGRGGL